MADSKNDICGLALGELGNYEVVDIDNPITDVEFTCKRWYETTKNSALREGVFNFSIGRRIISRDAETPTFGWAYQFTIPSDILRVLTVGDTIEDSPFLNYSIEKNKIMTDEAFDDGMPIRYIENVQAVGRFDDDVVEYIAKKLAYNMCMDLNNDPVLKARLKITMNEAKLQALASCGQESRPVVVSSSRYKKSRRAGNYPSKRRIY